MLPTSTLPCLYDQPKLARGTCSFCAEPCRDFQVVSLGSMVGVILPHGTSICKLEVMMECDPEKESWWWQQGSHICSQSLLPPHCSKGDQGAGRGAPSTLGSSCISHGAHCKRALCDCDLAPENICLPFTWPCSMKFRTPELGPRTCLFWMGSWSFSVDLRWAPWLFKSCFALERLGVIQIQSHP